jgi:hypothetical protein
MTRTRDLHCLATLAGIAYQRTAERRQLARAGQRHRCEHDIGYLGGRRPLAEVAVQGEPAPRDRQQVTGATEFDAVAGLIVDVLSNTTPATASSGQPGKAKYHLAPGVAEATKAASAELLDQHPLYPGLVL